jgi:hypothetical protein
MKGTSGSVSGARHWRNRLRRLAHDLGFEDWEESSTGTQGDRPGDSPDGAQPSLDEILREAAEAKERQPDDEAEDGTT